MHYNLDRSAHVRTLVATSGNPLNPKHSVTTFNCINVDPVVNGSFLNGRPPTDVNKIDYQGVEVRPEHDLCKQKAKFASKLPATTTTHRPSCVAHSL